MGDRRCLPVASSVKEMQVIRVTYCTGAGTEADPAHSHEAYYTFDGTLLVERCTYPQALTVRRSVSS